MKKEIREYVQQNRRDFSNAPLEESDAPASPFRLFEKWFDNVLKAEITDPYAFTLATATADGMPSARVVYMRDISEKGLTCFTNYKSRKGNHLAENPVFCANFYWEDLARQVRFEGKVEKVSELISDEYFASRPRESQIGAWASDQSSGLPSRKALEEKLEALKAKFDGDSVPRPPYWGGYLLIPTKVEFWQGRESRLHDRLEYTLEDDAKWNLQRLSP